MMTEPLPRWRLRLDNYRRALARLDEAVQLARQRPLSDLERQGLIKSFEFSFELAWNLLKDYLDYQGASFITGSRDAIREAFARGLIDAGEAWLGMLQDRNRTVHTYNEPVAAAIAERILEHYHPLFQRLSARMEQLARRDDA